MRYFANTLKTRKKFQRCKSFSRIRISQITEQKKRQQQQRNNPLLAFIFSYLISSSVRVVEVTKWPKARIIH
jgi:hypothetical protein